MALYCSACGTALRTTDRFCAACGGRVDPPPSVTATLPGDDGQVVPAAIPAIVAPLPNAKTAHLTSRIWRAVQADAALCLEPKMRRRLAMTLIPPVVLALLIALGYQGYDLVLRYRSLPYAIEHGDVSAVRRLLDRGAKMTADNPADNTPLIQAVRGRFDVPAEASYQIVQLLLDHGADVNAQQRDDGETVLSQAAGPNDLRLVQLLLDRGADVNGGRGAALCAAARGGKPQIVRLLLDRGAQVNAKHSLGTALNQARSLMESWGDQDGHPYAQVIDLLIRAGARDEPGEPSADSTGTGASPSAGTDGRARGRTYATRS